MPCSFEYAYIKENIRSSIENSINKTRISLHALKVQFKNMIEDSIGA